jgi:hypothetical protein
MDNTFREVEDLALSLIYGDGVILGEELGLLGDTVAIDTVFDQIIHAL